MNCQAIGQSIHLCGYIYTAGMPEAPLILRMTRYHLPKSDDSGKATRCELIEPMCGETANPGMAK
jgi:hypothetical protein